MTVHSPLVRLGEADRASLVRHFLSLRPEDRRLRFGAPVADAGVRAYVARIDMEADGVFAVRCGEELGAVVHVAFSEDLAELGLSVLPQWRLQGLGNRLFECAVAFVHGRGVSQVFVHCRKENGAMMHLARKHGMRIAASGEESDARLGLVPVRQPGATAP